MVGRLVQGDPSQLSIGVAVHLAWQPIDGCAHGRRSRPRSACSRDNVNLKTASRDGVLKICRGAPRSLVMPVS